MPTQLTITSIPPIAAAAASVASRIEPTSRASSAIPVAVLPLAASRAARALA
jgi:hypothetical protein